MDTGEGGGGDGGGGEERDADLSPQALSLPLLTQAIVPEQGSPSRISAMAPAKEPLTLPQQGEVGAEGSQAREGGGQKEGGQHSQAENEGHQKYGKKEDFMEGSLSGQRKGEGKVHACVGEASFKGGLPAALSNRGGEEEKEEEEAISNQSQTKSKCSLLPQQSQHSSSSSTAKASGTLDSKTAASPKPSNPSFLSPKPFPFSPTSPKHFSCPSSSSALLSETEVKDIKGDQGWISGFHQSFRSQQSSMAFPLVGIEPASSPAEDDVPTGVPHSSISSGNGAKAPEPNDSQLDTVVDEEKDKEEDQKDAVLKNLNQDLSPNSLTSHMAIMHSRNSCKTLKCPKCNWHYKSQHTLQVHMKEKHPETGGQCVCGVSAGKCVCGGATRDVCAYCSSGKPHPRLARGETYACGYKPYRCKVCDYATSSKGNLSIHMQSDKHLNNVQSGGHANGPVHASLITNNSSSNGQAADEQHYNKLPLSVASPTAQPNKVPPPAHSHSHGKRWRCDVCDYETSIARNLRIHTTSEKHTHNMLRLQRGYYLSQCRSLAPHLKHLQNPGAELSLSMRLASQQVAEQQPVTFGSTLTPSPSPSPSPPPAPSLSPNGPLSQGVFQCLVCSCFSSDSLESVEQHLNASRSLPQSEWCSLVAGGCHCRLCGYTTPLRANFSLHCQTDRHRTRYQLAAHLQEGGDRGQEGAALIAKGNPVQLRCNLCDFVTSSLEKLQGHSLTSQHEASIRVYRFLQQYDGEVDGGSWLFHCLLCNHSSSSKLQVLKHSQTSAHQQREGLLQLQPMGGEELAAIFTIRKSPDGVTDELIEDMETSSVSSTDPLDTTKDTSNVGEKISEETEKTKAEEGEKEESLPSLKRPSPGCGEMDDSIVTKRPRTHQQNENQQTVQCPLCQVKLAHTHLRQHLTHVHNVAQDCVDKLISAVTPSLEQAQPPSESQLQADLLLDDIQKKKITKNNNCSYSADSNASADSPKNKGVLVENADGDIATPKDVTALLTPPLEDNNTHPFNGTLALQSPTQTPPSSPPTSPPSDPLPFSDRHGYRFRCSRCSLAFPTQKKLQLHWQYHAMRAATECPLCSRQCRSQEALQRHMQNAHSQQDNTQGQSTLLPHPTVQYMEHSTNSVQQDFTLSPQVGQEAGEDDDAELDEEVLGIDEREEQKEVDIKEKEGASEVGGVDENLTDLDKGTHEEIVSEPISSSAVKKSSNPTMDRYLDPSRPYKCAICSESFTQKTILLVHYNSVSHLHRARRALQDSGASAAAPETPRGPDARPYRCRLCGVGYSQSSTLDIHLRSVLHQTRARAAQNSTQQSSASTLAVPTSTPTTSAQAATSKEETSKSLSVAKKLNGVSCSTSSVVSLGLLAETQPPLSDPIDSQQAKKKVAELLASRNQLMLLQQQQQIAQAQAQVQAQLQQQTALLQSQAIHSLSPENLLKQHFSLVPDNLLSLQQQLLLPFYLSGDVKLNPDLTIKSSDFGHLVSLSSLLKEQVKAEAKTESHADGKETKKPCSKSSVNQPLDLSQNEDTVDVCSGSSNEQKGKEHFNSGSEEDKEDVHNSDQNKNLKTETVSSSFAVPRSQCPPPRVPYAAANGEPLKALLQSYGYEMALQYLQSRHRHQQQILPPVSLCKITMCSQIKRDGFSQLQKEKLEDCNNNNKGVEENEEKKVTENEPPAKQEKKCCETGEKCRDCGKLFSDALILKSHQEYIHRTLFPTAALEKFSREYRLQYDQMYPIAESKSVENLNACTQASAPTSTPDKCTEQEPTTESMKSQGKSLESPPLLSVSDSIAKVNDTTQCLKNTPGASSQSSSSQPQEPQQQEAPVPGSSTTALSQITTPLTLPLPKLPMLPLSLPQLPLPPLTIPKLPLPPIPFPMELPLLPPVVMQSMALQTQPWLDSSINPELAKLYQAQLNPALLGQQPQLSPALLAPQSQPSPALLGPPPQLSPTLLNHSTQPTQTGQQSQISPSIPEQQQGKRTRTRISEEQLSVLKNHFDINSLPSDEEINKMSALSGLPHKVIKHWFRNTLFKERQRDKDSPYNFNNPPTTALEESREDVSKKQCLTLSPCSPSPGLTTNASPPSQPVGEHHRGRRSSRTRFTEQQLETLQGVFEATPYPREEEYDRLSALLSLPNRVIVVWFQNARQRARKNQDRGADDGLDGKNQLDNIDGEKNGSSKTDVNNQDNNYENEGQADSQNENSMDLTYEYYTHPDSPALDSSTYSESEHTTPGNEQTSTARKQEDIVSCQANSNPAPVHTRNKVLDTDIHQKGTSQPTESGSCQQPASPPEKHPTLIASSSQKTLSPISSVSRSDQRSAHSPDCDQSFEKVAESLPSPPSSLESEEIPTRLTDATACLFTETQPQLKAQAQFQCSLCPLSLPSFQLWQEHQTRHLLAAQSQVQLFHQGFTDRTMPYMMLHPNHTLMASQMLSGAMSQIPPNPTHPMISHLNNIQMKSTFSDPSISPLNNSLTTLKQSTKHASENSSEGQRGNREIEDEHRRDKRQRTTITPEQLEVLYQRYSLDSNPTRGVLESIARDVGLTRRVVQVWFQNTRARERKGQFRSVGPGTSFTLGLNHLRCPFCRALFKVKSALDAHIRSRHWAEAERAGYNLSVGSGSNGQTVMAMSSVMERPGPSISSKSIPNPGYEITNKDLTMKLPVASLSSSIMVKNHEENVEYEEDDEDFPCEDSSSMTDQGLPSPGVSGDLCSDWSETLTQQQQQQRQRTQMSHFQVLQLKDFYRNHRTPNRLECERLGRELGLPPRVVQVWFQNARAKEKRARSLTSDSAEREQADLSAGAVERDRA
ncbi:zinc finger homeobox protein 3 [Nothobranchius furzeri]|uniref:Zinc finger homeobox 2 n=1 Tax=Nothobranchius furzeri TaxID=105023 RepID=A0A1A7ZEZ0_NOTFU|nr:zinc finger homeobox protein 3 [Nothobranchius furzeri]KAF7224562.1 zinc finger homeobox protein 3-like [Nothobranchius furzeri]